VCIGAKPDVIGQVKTRVIGIVIDHDVVGVPEPTIHIAEIRLCNLKEKAAKAKSLRRSAGQTPDVLPANGASKASVFPGMVKMVASIVSFMPYPAIVFCVNVRGFRMAFLITVAALCRLPVVGSGRWMRRRM